MEKLIFSLCITVTVVIILYAFILFRRNLEQDDENKIIENPKIYVDTDGAYALSQHALVGIICAQINGCINTSLQANSSPQNSIMQKYNSPYIIEARHAVAVIITIEAAWSYLDASNDSIRSLCDALVLECAKSFNINQHLPQLATIMEAHENIAEACLEVARYISHIASPAPDAIAHLILTTHAKDEMMLMLDVTANLFKKIKIENSGRIIFLKDVDTEYV